MNDVSWLDRLTGASQFYQHAICLSNDPIMINLFVGANIAVFMSYFAMGGSLLARRRYTIRLSNTATFLYGMFIFLCGLDHFVTALTVYSGIYYIEIIVLILTALVSLLTAFATLREYASTRE